LRRLDEFGIPNGPINAIDQVFADPQVVHRGMAVETVHPLSPDLKMIRNPLHFSETPIERYAPPPMLGQHTDEILMRDLALDAEARAALRREGVI